MIFDLLQLDTHATNSGKYYCSAMMADAVQKFNDSEQQSFIELRAPGTENKMTTDLDNVQFKFEQLFIEDGILKLNATRINSALNVRLLEALQAVEDGITELSLGNITMYPMMTGSEDKDNVVQHVTIHGVYALPTPQKKKRMYAT